VRIVAGAVLLALATTGCGAATHGSATLWVTEDRGTRVLFAGRVPAGLTAMQGLERDRPVTTRYGGRFVESIDGISGSLTGQRDWFFYVNGIEAGVGATEVTLHPGDVEWWDYRSWGPGNPDVPVVAGAFPWPFLGAPTRVASSGVTRTVARAIATEVHGTIGAAAGRTDAIVVSSRVPRGYVRIRQTGGHVVLALGAGIARRLAADPTALRYRFGAAP
jgi:Domain of unknown function (DUF4430)